MELGPLQMNATQQEKKWEKRQKIFPVKLAPFKQFPQKSHITVLLTYHWQDRCDTVMPRCKEGWEEIF